MSKSTATRQLSETDLLILKVMTREEAIEVIRKSWPVSRNELLREAIKTLVPELRKSEDERIRTDIMAFIEFALEDGSAVSLGSNTTKEEALAYLEKQKLIAWSDEDEKTLNAIIDMVGNSLYEPLRPRAIMLSWLNSLRQQNFDSNF